MNLKLSFDCRVVKVRGYTPKTHSLIIIHAVLFSQTTFSQVRRVQISSFPPVAMFKGLGITAQLRSKSRFCYVNSCDKQCIFILMLHSLYLNQLCHPTI